MVWRMCCKMFCGMCLSRDTVLSLRNYSTTVMHLYARIAVLLCKMCHSQMALQTKLWSFTHGLAGLERVMLKLWNIFLHSGMVEAKLWNNVLFAINHAHNYFPIYCYHVSSCVMWVQMILGDIYVHYSMPGSRDLLYMRCFLRCTDSCPHMTHHCSHRLPRCMIDRLYRMLHNYNLFGCHGTVYYPGN